MYWLVRLGSIENRMDNQANIWVQGEEECAKKMSFGSLLSCSSWSIYVCRVLGPKTRVLLLGIRVLGLGKWVPLLGIWVQ